MFENYEYVGWAGYGVEGPGLKNFETLASPKAKPAAVDDALWNISEVVYNMGQASLITEETVPFLVEVVASSSATAHARAKVLRFLSTIITDERDQFFEPLDWQDGVIDEIRKHTRKLVPSLDNADPVVRLEAARLAAHLEPRPKLAAHIAREKQPQALASLLFAASVLGEKVKFIDYLSNQDARVRGAAAIAAIRQKPTPQVIEALIAAVDEPRADDPKLPFFQGRLRAAAIEAMRRFGRGQPKIIEALIERRHQPAQIGRDQQTLGSLAVHALVAIAVPTPGTPDAAGKRILTAILDAQPNGLCGLPADPLALRQLLGLAPASRPTPLQDRIRFSGKSQTLREACLSLICGTRKWDPKPFLAALEELPAERRAELGIALATGAEEINADWDYERLHGMRDQLDEDAGTLTMRREERCRVLSFALLIGAGAAARALLAARIDDLRQRASEAKKRVSQNQYWLRYADPLHLMVVAEARLFAEAGEPIPERLHELLAKAGADSDWEKEMRELLPKLGKKLVAVARNIEGKEGELLNQSPLWWYADLLPPSLIPQVLRHIRKADHDVEVVKMRRVCESLCKQGRHRDADRLMRECAKSTHASARITWTTADGAKLTVRGLSGDLPLLNRGITARPRGRR
jgi:hypothetical protein